MGYPWTPIWCGIALVLASGSAVGGHTAALAGAGMLAEGGCAATYGSAINGTLAGGLWDLVTRLTPASPPRCLSSTATSLRSWHGVWNATTGGCIVHASDILCMENPRAAGADLTSYDVAYHAPPVSAQGQVTIKIVR